MRFENVCIESVAYHLPKNIVTSEEIENHLSPIYHRLKLPFGRLEMMSGIRERRFWGKGVNPSEVSSVAGNMAIEKSGIDREIIECLISASVCRDFLEPATASVIHNNLKLSQEAFIFDVSNACLGVLNGMSIVANMIEMGQIRAGLVVSGENGGPLVDNTVETLLADPKVTRADIKLAFASLTIGSAAAAVLLVHKDVSRLGHKLLGGANMSATSFNNLCRGKDNAGMVGFGMTPLMQTDSEALLHAGIDLGKQTWERAKFNLGWKNEDVDRVFTHQVSVIHRRLMYNALELDSRKDFSTLEFLGNTGSAALPVTLALGEEQGYLKKRDNIALLGIGSGLNCLMLGLEW